MKRGIDILGLGCTAVDELLSVERYPAADVKLRVSKWERHCGGLTATALVTAARLGAHCAYAGVLGKDVDSRFVLETLGREGVNTQHAVLRSGARPVRATVVVCQKKATRTIFYTTEGVVGADTRRPSAEVIRSARVLLVDRFGIPGMVRAARLARAAGIPVVGDFETAETPQLPDLLPWVDHLVVSHGFAKGFTGQSRPDKAAVILRARGHAVVVVTCGKKGCWYLGRSDRSAVHVAAFPIQAVDTTGCGDVFHGAYAAALAKGAPLGERILLASAAAALKASRGGGPSGIPNRAQIKTFLKGNRRAASPV